MIEMMMQTLLNNTKNEQSKECKRPSLWHGLVRVELENCGLTLMTAFLNANEIQGTFKLSGTYDFTWSRVSQCQIARINNLQKWPVAQMVKQ